MKYVYSWAPPTVPRSSHNAMMRPNRTRFPGQSFNRDSASPRRRASARTKPGEPTARPGSGWYSCWSVTSTTIGRSSGRPCWTESSARRPKSPPHAPTPARATRPAESSSCTRPTGPTKTTSAVSLHALRELGISWRITYKTDDDTTIGVYGRHAATYISQSNSLQFATRKHHPQPSSATPRSATAAAADVARQLTPP